jgi:hemolysin activation/secretion protein
MSKLSRSHLLSGCIAIVTPVLVSAQQQLPPGAGDVSREVQRATRPAQALRDVAPKAADVPSATSDAPTVFVQRFQLEGATLVAGPELDTALAPYVGRSLTLAQLSAVPEVIVEVYRRHGWFATAYLPRQDVLDGTVRLAVLEGRLAGINVKAEGHPANIEFLRAIAGAGLTLGAPLQHAALERGLLLANDAPRVSVTGVLEPGSAAGDVRLRLEMSPSVPAVVTDGELRNYGPRATGHEQALAGVDIVGNQGWGDRLAVRTLVSRGTRALVGGADFNAGIHGVRVSGQVSLARYRLLEEFRALDANGEAHSVAFAAVYPIVRSERANLNVSGGPSWRRLIDRALSTRIRDRRVTGLTLSLDGERRDDGDAAAVTAASLAMTVGHANLRHLDADALQDAAGAHVQGAFAKLSFSASRLQSLGKDWSLNAHANGQVASKNLDSSERFVLGGPGGVRAYPVGEGLGDAGWIGTLEVRKDLPSHWQGFGFVDGGRIRVQRWVYAGSSVPNEYALAGVGLGARWSGTQGRRFEAALALPVGTNRGAHATGANQDGSRRGARLWLRAATIF